MNRATSTSLPGLKSSQSMTSGDGSKVKTGFGKYGEQLDPLSQEQVKALKKYRRKFARNLVRQPQ